MFLASVIIRARRAVLALRTDMEATMIRYMGTRKNMEGATVYVFVINGLQKEVKESSLKQHPGCYEALPADAKAKIAANRNWMSKL
jgi:hypothetical protein